MSSVGSISGKGGGFLLFFPELILDFVLKTRTQKYSLLLNRFSEIPYCKKSIYAIFKIEESIYENESATVVKGSLFKHNF